MTLRHPFPRQLRQTLQLFRFYEESLGLDSVLNRIDWIPVTSLQLYSAGLGRLPESLAVANNYGKENARQAFQDILNSPEFQAEITRNLLQAFPEKQRVLLVHTPRTAGTDFEERLAEKMPYIHQSMQFPDIVGKQELYLHLRNFALNIDMADRILACGHQPLTFYVENSLRRPDDRLVTVIRDPLDLLISHANYIVTVLRSNDPIRTDRQLWLHELGLDDLSEDHSGDTDRELAREILRRDSMTPQNPLCHFLGKGTAESALELIVTSNIELTDVIRYSDWLELNWGMKAVERRNRSISLLRWQDLGLGDRELLQARTREDRKLYSLIFGRLAESKELSIEGVSLLERPASALG